MNIKAFYFSSASIALAMFLGRVIPARLGFWLADRVGNFIAAKPGRKSLRALRQNLAHVLGDKLSPVELDALVSTSFRQHARRLFEFYHYLDRPAEIDRRIKFSPALQRFIDEWNAQSSGVLIMGVHLSAFDLGLIALARKGLKILALSVPNPNSQYSKQNEIREDHGLDLQPIGPSALQNARLRLQHGGLVVTGLDRPVPDATYAPMFFGKPSNLPVFYTRLALKTRVPIIVVAAHDLPDGTHQIECSEYIQMESKPDPSEEIIYNTEKVLRQAEKFIAAYPEQWAMFFPVWPDPEE